MARADLIRGGDAAIRRNAAKLVIITGMSGAGKTIAVQSLEDLGFFCVDNLPPVLIPKFAELIEQSSGKIGKVALVIDLSGREFFTALSESLNYMKEHFTIGIRNFVPRCDGRACSSSGTRKAAAAIRWPPEGVPLEGIRLERRLLEELKGMATQVIDTSGLKPAQLKALIADRFPNARQARHRDQSDLVRLQIRHSDRRGSDLRRAVSCRIRIMSSICGRTPGQDPEVYEYVMKWSETQTFLANWSTCCNFLIPQYIKEGKSQVVIGIGCTGRQASLRRDRRIPGRHARQQRDGTVRVSHRDAERDRAKADGV